MRILQIVEQAFRTLVEEQDDTILWLSQSMLGAGAEMEVLLSGNAVYYATLKGRQPVLKLGDWVQKEPADIPKDLGRLLEKGVPVYVLQSELDERGISKHILNAEVEVINMEKLVGIYNRVDQVWQW